MGLFDFVRDTVDQFRYPDQHPEAWSRSYKSEKQRRARRTNSCKVDREGMHVIFYGEWFKESNIDRSSLDTSVYQVFNREGIRKFRYTTIKLDMVREGLTVLRWVADGDRIKGKKVLRVSRSKDHSDLAYLEWVLAKVINHLDQVHELDEFKCHS